MLGADTTNKNFELQYNPKIVLITGGTGSLGHALIDHILSQKEIKVIRILSRDELKQAEMQQYYKNNEKLRFFIGDIRDQERVDFAMQNVDYVIHAAAMKRIEACEYNPYDAVQTNIIGTKNVIMACIRNKVERAVFVSTDKAVDPCNLYGATKQVAEKLWLNFHKKSDTVFTVVRWGNVLSSRGSVIPLFLEQKKRGVVTITDKRMTRFFITLPDAAKFCWLKLLTSTGGEISIPDLPSIRIIDLAKAVAPYARIEYVGIRQGEKLHEKLADGYTSDSRRRILSFEKVKKLYESL